MNKDVEVRLRREHVPNGVPDRRHDFWTISINDDLMEESIETAALNEMKESRFGG